MTHPATTIMATPSNRVIEEMISRQANISKEIDDADILEAIGAGDEQAMEIFYHRYNKSVFQFAVKIIKSQHDAAEILNEVMLEVWRKPTNFQGRSKASTWLLSITHHKAVDLIRKNARHDNNVSVELDQIDSEQESLSSVLAKNVDAQHMRDCINKLPMIHQQVIYLAFYEELSYPEIAKILGVPTGTIKTRMMHAKNSLLKVVSK